MSKKIKYIYTAVMILVTIYASYIKAETISGTISYNGTTSTGTFWVWASTAPMGQEGSEPVALSSYTANGTPVGVPYTLQIPTALLPRQFYVYAARDVNPPFVEEYLQNPQSGINPVYGDPIGEYQGGIYVDVGQNPSNINFAVLDPPQGKVSGTIYYSSTVPAGVVLKIAIGHQQGDWISQPVDYREVQNPVFPVSYQLNYLPDATDYYVVAILDDNNPNTSDPVGMYGPITISGGNWVQNVDFALSVPGGGGGTGGGGTSVIEGNVIYGSPNIISGPLVIAAFIGYPAPENPPKGYRKIYSPMYPQFFRIDQLPDSTGYYIFAFVDANDNGQPESTTEPMGIYGPFTLSGYAQVNVTILNPEVTSGNNSIKGIIVYQGTVQGYVYIKVGYGDGNKIYDVKGMTSRYGAGYYEISNLPDGENYYISAFMDLNNNASLDYGEPYSGLIGPISLSNGTQALQDIQLQDFVVSVGTITVTIRGKVVDSNFQPLGGVEVSLIDTGGFNDYDPSNDRVVAVVVSSPVFNTDNAGNQYNYEFVNIPGLVVSDQYYYGYRVGAYKQGYKKVDTWYTFYSYQNGQTVYVYDLYMYPKPEVTITSFSVTPQTISPDNDGINDNATVKFVYNISTTQESWENSAEVKFVVDSDDDGNFEPFDPSIFIWDNQGRIFKKKDPNYYVDWSKPLDYTKLEGPLSQDEYNRIVASYDATISWWINGWDLTVDYYQGKSYKEIEFFFDGKNSVGQVVKNGTHNVKLLVYDVQKELVATATAQVTIQTNSIIGQVKDTSGKSIDGAKVVCIGPNFWTQVYTDTNGNFEISGLKSGNIYRIEVSKEGYVQKVIDNISPPTNVGLITLDTGVKISGYIILRNPPKSGTVRDPNGYLIYDLWCHIDAQNLSGGPWVWKDVRIPLPDTEGVSITSAPYTVYVSPNTKYRLVAKTQGYVSKEVIIDVGQQTITQSIELTKCVFITGRVKLPEDIQAINEIKQLVGSNGLGVNIWANSKDGKYNSGSWVWFSEYELSAGSSKTFIIDNIVPNTTYTVGIDAEYFIKHQRNVWVGGEPKVLLLPFELKLGGILEGIVRFGPGVYSQLSSDAIQTEWDPNTNQYKPGIRVQIELQSMQDFKIFTYGVFVTTDVIVSASSVTFEIPGLQPGVAYRFIRNTWPFRNVEVIYPVETIFISTTTSKTVLSSPIEYVIPTGVLKGKLVNKTGKSIDWNKVQVQLAIFDVEGGVFFTTPDENGNFMFSGVPSGEGVIWGCEYSTKPFMFQADYFGRGTGNTGMFGKSIYGVHGSTVDIGEIELKPAGVIQVVLKAEPSLIDELYTGTTSFLKMVYSGEIHLFGLYGLVRVQPLWLRQIGEKMAERERAKYAGTPYEEYVTTVEEMSVGIDSTIEKKDSNTLVYTFNSAEDGLCNVYIMVGKNKIAVYEQPGQPLPGVIRAEEYTAYPMQYSLVAKAGLTQTVTFYVSRGVEINGSVTRDPSSVGKEEVIKVVLKEPSSGKIIADYDVIFDSMSKHLTTKSFKFNRIPPGGKVILVVWSPNYKVYTQEIDLTSLNIASISLTPIVLTKGANIVGRVIDESGRGIAKGVVVECVAVPYVEGSYRNTEMEGLSISADIGKEGQFRLTNLPKGTYVVKVYNKPESNTNYIPITKAGILVPDSPVDVDIGNIVVKTGVEMSGSVYSPDGKPLPNVLVVTYPQDVQLRWFGVCTQTDKDGKFILRGINNEIKYWELKVNVRSDDPSKDIPELRRYTEFVKSYINVQQKENRENIKITLRLANAEIKGRVVTSDGGQLMLPFEIEGIDTKDLLSAVVLLQSPKDIASGDPFSGVKLLTQIDGSFVINGISAGKYVLKVFSRGYSTKIIEIDVKEGTNDVGVITLEKGARVVGTIRTPSGEKVDRTLARAVIAADKKFKEILIGFVRYNPDTLQVEDYEINGLKAGVTYYFTIVPERTDFVITDPVPLYVNSSNAQLTKNLVYAKPKPHFEVKSYKFKEIKRDYVLKWLEFFEYGNLELLLEMPKDTWATHLMIAQMLKGKDVNISSLPETFDIFIILGFVSQPIIAQDVNEVVSAVTISGNLLPLGLSDNKKQFVVAYIPTNYDVIRGYFELQFTAVNYYSERNQENYRFYLGEDAKAEKVVSPLVGGSSVLGENDDSALEIPPGTEFEDVDVFSDVKIVITKYAGGTVSKVAEGKLSPRLFATRLPSPASYPGELVSAIYDMQVRLITGPLATLAKNNKVKLTIALSSGSVKQEEADMYKLCYYNENTNKWEVEDTPVTIDWQSLLATAEVTHLSKFAIFKVTVSTQQPYSGEFKSYVYPNPVKNVDKFNIRVCIPGSGNKVKAEVKIYNIAGELVRSLEQEVTPGYVNDIKDIEVVNDKGEKLASGVYIMYIKVDKYKKLHKFAIIR